MCITLTETVLWSCLWNAVMFWDLPLKASVVLARGRFISISCTYNLIHMKLHHLMAWLSKSIAFVLFLFEIEIVSCLCFKAMSTIISWWWEHSLLAFAWLVVKSSCWSSEPGAMACFLVTHNFLKVSCPVVAYPFIDNFERLKPWVFAEPVDYLWLRGIYWTCQF